MNKRILLATVATLSLASVSAFANGSNSNPSGGSNSNSNSNTAVAGAASVSVAGSHSTSRSNSSATGGNALATGGSAQGGTGVAFGGTGLGGTGGTSNAAASGLGGLGGQGGIGGAAQGGSNSLTVMGSQAAARAPDVVVPGGGGFDCPTVGFGASGAALTGGGGFGPSWISTDCNNRKLAEMLYNMGYHQQAAQLLADQFPQVAKALAETNKQVAALPVAVPVEQSLPVPPVPSSVPAFCHTPGLAVSLYPECHV